MSDVSAFGVVHKREKQLNDSYGARKDRHAALGGAAALTGAGAVSGAAIGANPQRWRTAEMASKPLVTRMLGGGIGGAAIAPLTPAIGAYEMVRPRARLKARGRGAAFLAGSAAITAGGAYAGRKLTRKKVAQ